MTYGTHHRNMDVQHVTCSVQLQGSGEKIEKNIRTNLDRSNETQSKI